jgi:Leucine-rich repeat (LRR) protein
VVIRKAAICGFILGTLALPALAAISFAEERQVALWILRRGGQVMVEGVADPIGDPFDLPDRDFRIVMVDLHGTVIEPKQLVEIQKLEHVRELYVPARVWSPVSDVKAPFSDESFQYYQGMKQLERFHAGLTTLAWLDIGDEGVKRMAPLAQLKHLRLNNTTIKDPKDFEALVNLESLDLGDAYVLDYSLAPLAKMKNLRRLNLLGTLVTDDGLKHLRDLTQMEDLDLYGVRVTDAGVEHLRNMTGLRRLNMLGGQITDASAETLSQFRELRELNLYRSKITDAGLTRLQSLKNLEMLDLRYSGVTSAGVQSFRVAVPRCKVTFVDSAPRRSTSNSSTPQGSSEAAIAKWIESLGGQVRMSGASIQAISLARVAFDDKRLEFLAKLSSLERLNLDGTDVSDLGLPTIAKLTGLRDLSLNFTSISDRGLSALGPLQKVRRLMLAGTQITGAAFSRLAGWTELRELDLTSAPVTNEAMPHIGKMTNLERLLLSYSDVTDEGLEPIAKLTNLAVLDLHGVDVKDPGMVHLAAAKSIGSSTFPTADLPRKAWLCLRASHAWSAST